MRRVGKVSPYLVVDVYIFVLAKAFKEGKIGAMPPGMIRPPGGAMIPPPMGYLRGPPMAMGNENGFKLWLFIKRIFNSETRHALQHAHAAHAVHDATNAHARHTYCTFSKAVFQFILLRNGTASDDVCEHAGQCANHGS